MLTKENRLIKESRILKKNRLIKENKLIHESKDKLSARSLLICIYKRIREKKKKTHQKFKRIQFFIECKG